MSVPATDPGPAMEVTDSLLDLVGETPMLALHRTGRDLSCHLLAKARVPEPRRERQGPPCPGHDRRGRAGRQAAARGHHRRAHLWQHRRWPGHGGCPARVPLRLHDAGQDRLREDATAARLRGRGDRVPDGGGPGAPRVLLLGGRPGHGFDTRGLPAQPVPQPREPGLSLPLDRARRSGGRRRTASPTSWPASAPAGRSAGSAAT